MQLTSRRSGGWPLANLGTAVATAAVLGIGIAAVPTTVASAAEATDAFAYQVVDCSTPGADYGVAAGTPEESFGSVGDVLRANVYNGATLVMPAQLRSEPDPDRDFLATWATVPPDVEYTFVRFEWTDFDGNPVYLDTPAPEPEVCDDRAVSLGPTTDPGPGLVPVSPVRLYDTRRGRPQRAAAPIGAGRTLSVRVTGANGVPADASAVMVNVTAANPSAPGFLTVYPCGVAVPKTSSVNFAEAETRAGSAFSKVGSAGEVCIFASVTTDVVVDLNGYVADSTSPTAIVPIRVADTRYGAPTDVSDAQKGKTDRLAVPMTAFGAADVSNLILNITAVSADEPGHVVVGGCNKGGFLAGGPPASASSVLNFVPGQAQANLAFIHPVGWDYLCFFATSPAHLIVDLVGSTSGASPLLGSAPSNQRLLDTRSVQATSDGQFMGIGQLKANVPLKLKVRDRLSAVGATAAALNVTAANESARGHITVYPCGTVPLASNLNYTAGVAVANLAFTELDVDGNVCIVSHVDTDLVVDLAAVNSSRVQFADLYANENGGWAWTPLSQLKVQDWGTELPLAGGTPGYTLTGQAITGVTFELSPTGTFVVSPPDDSYVIAERTYTLTDSGGNTQTVTLDVKFDPQI